MLRTLVAVGMVSDASMLAAMRATAPRSGVAAGSGATSSTAWAAWAARWPTPPSPAVLAFDGGVTVLERAPARRPAATARAWSFPGLPCPAPGPGDATTEGPTVAERTPSVVDPEDVADKEFAPRSLTEEGSSAVLLVVVDGRVGARRRWNSPRGACSSDIASRS